MFIFSLFIAGLVSVLSPCILPLLPVYLGVLTDQNGSTVKKTFLGFGFDSLVNIYTKFGSSTLWH